MGCGCNYSGVNAVGVQKSRSFLTREEKVDLLSITVLKKQYLNGLNI